jgi:predicted ATPase
VQRASALRATKGVAAPDTGQAYERAVALARTLRDTARLVPALNGLYAFHMVRGQCDAALAPAQALLQAAQERGDAIMQMIGHRAVGAVAFHLGDPRTAREHLEFALSAYDPAVHAPLAVTLGIDHKVTASNFLSLTLFVLGDQERALQVQRAGLAQADAMDHAHSKAQALVFGCLLLALRGDWQELPTWAERVIDLGRSRGFPLMEGGGTFFLGAAQAFDAGGTAALEAGLHTMQQGAQLWWGTGARNYRSYGELLMAQAQAALGRSDAARQLLGAAREGIHDTGERWVEPELLRMEGLLLREVDGQAACIARLQQASALAQAQGAAGWERRAAISLAQAQAQLAAATAATTP